MQTAQLTLGRSSFGASSSRDYNRGGAPLPLRPGSQRLSGGPLAPRQCRKPVVPAHQHPQDRRE
jgi:hypothetical protein